MKKTRRWRKRKDRVWQRYWYGRKKRRRYTKSIDQAKYVTLYHGTTKDRATKILKEGLKPSEVDFVTDKPSVFLTPSKSAAVHHALTGPEKEFYEKIKPIKEKLLRERGYVSQKDYPRFPEDAVILKVTLPIQNIIEKSSLKYNRPLQQRIPKKDVISVYEVPFADKIPPTNIKLLNFNKFEKKALREHGYDTQTKYKEKPLREGLVTGPYPWEKKRIREERKKVTEKAPEGLRQL